MLDFFGNFQGPTQNCKSTFILSLQTNMSPLQIAEIQGHEEVVRLLRDMPEDGAGPG